MKTNKHLINYNFAIADSTTWIGEDLLDFYSNALLTFNTATALTVIPNVKSIVKLPSYNLGSILQSDTIAGATSWNATGEGALADKSFSVTPVKVNLEIPKAVFEQDFLSTYMKAGANTDETAPPAFVNYMTTQVMKQLSNDLEVIAWQGVGTGSTYPVELSTGFVGQLTGDSTSVKVTTTAATASNVIGILTAVYNKIPTSVLLNYKDVKFYVSSAVARAYRLAQAASGAGAGYNYASDTVKMNFLGFDLIECPGLAGSQIVAASEKNMLLLTDLAEDFEKDSSISVIDMWKNFGISSVRIALRFKIGFGYKLGSEIVIAY